MMMSLAQHMEGGCEARMAQYIGQRMPIVGHLYEHPQPEEWEMLLRAFITTYDRIAQETDDPSPHPYNPSTTTNSFDVALKKSLLAKVDKMIEDVSLSLIPFLTIPLTFSRSLPQAMEQYLNPNAFIESFADSNGGDPMAVAGEEDADGEVAQPAVVVQEKPRRGRKRKYPLPTETAPVASPTPVPGEGPEGQALTLADLNAEDLVPGHVLLAFMKHLHASLGFDGQETAELVDDLLCSRSGASGADDQVPLMALVAQHRFEDALDCEDVAVKGSDSLSETATKVSLNLTFTVYYVVTLSFSLSLSLSLSLLIGGGGLHANVSRPLAHIRRSSQCETERGKRALSQTLG